LDEQSQFVDEFFDDIPHQSMLICVSFFWYCRLSLRRNILKVILKSHLKHGDLG